MPTAVAAAGGGEPMKTQFRQVDDDHVVVDGITVAAQPVDDRPIPVAFQERAVAVVKVPVPYPGGPNRVHDGPQEHSMLLGALQFIGGKPEPFERRTGHLDPGGTVVTEHHVGAPGCDDVARLGDRDGLLRPP